MITEVDPGGGWQPLPADGRVDDHGGKLRVRGRVPAAARYAMSALSGHPFGMFDEGWRIDDGGGFEHEWYWRRPPPASGRLLVVWHEGSPRTPRKSWRHDFKLVKPAKQVESLFDGNTVE